MHRTVHAASRHECLQSFAIILIGLLIGGCGGKSGELKTYPAHGQATFQGKPMPNALITFHPIDGEAKTRHLLPRATVGEDGSYTLGTYRVGDGAPVGQYVVTIVWSNEFSSGIVSPSQPPADQLQGRYTNVQASKIQVAIEATDNTLPPIDLP